jgi:hypothetical protein
VAARRTGRPSTAKRPAGPAARRLAVLAALADELLPSLRERSAIGGLAISTRVLQAA